jgi:hypothetical protein
MCTIFWLSCTRSKRHVHKTWIFKHNDQIEAPTYKVQYGLH